MVVNLFGFAYTADTYAVLTVSRHYISLACRPRSHRPVTANGVVLGAAHNAEPTSRETQNLQTSDNISVRGDTQAMDPLSRWQLAAV